MICRAVASSKLDRTITRHPVATKFGHSDDFNQRHETPTSQCCKFKGLIREYSNRVVRRGLASLPTYERETISLVSTDSDVAEGPMGRYFGPPWILTDRD